MNEVERDLQIKRHIERPSIDLLRVVRFDDEVNERRAFAGSENRFLILMAVKDANEL
jgi:hypothetical protein